MLTVSIKDPKEGKFYTATIPPSILNNSMLFQDNGCLVSIGWTVGGDLSRRGLEELNSRGYLKEIDRDTWNHSGCQSSCVRRGGKACRW